MGQGNARRRWPAIVAAGAAAAVTASVAWAAIPGDDGTISACYGPKGLLRVVDSAADCLPAEQPLSWNQQGPPGPSTASGREVVRVAIDLAAGHEGQFNATCPDGKVAISGGFDGVSPESHVWASSPTPDAAEWAVYVSNEGTGVDDIGVYAVCVTG